MVLGHATLTKIFDKLTETNTKNIIHLNDNNKLSSYLHHCWSFQLWGFQLKDKNN